jgi:hypothetical protein
VIVFRRRGAAAGNPIEQVDIAAIQQRFEPIQLCNAEARETALGERAEDQVNLLRATVPAAEQEAPAASVDIEATAVAEHAVRIIGAEQVRMPHCRRDGHALLPFRPSRKGAGKAPIEGCALGVSGHLQNVRQPWAQAPNRIA